MLTVTDTGAGLSESQLQRIFGEGIQFNAAVLQAGQGSGLGLAIAKGIAVQHGGTLEVSSEGLGKGCTFTLELPAYCFSSEVVAADLSQLSTISISTEKHVQSESPCRCLANNMALNTNDDSLQTPPEKFLNTKKLLVVDDAALNRKMLIRLLRAQGHQCVEAKDGLGAIEEFTKCAPDDPFDCILMDNQMPNMDGPTAASRLRELGWEGLIIGVSGNVLKEDVQYYKSMGANAVLPKPLNMTDLEEIWQEQQSTEHSANTEPVQSKPAQAKDGQFQAELDFTNLQLVGGDAHQPMQKGPPEAMLGVAVQEEQEREDFQKPFQFHTHPTASHIKLPPASSSHLPHPMKASSLNAPAGLQLYNVANKGSHYDGHSIETTQKSKSPSAMAPGGDCGGAKVDWLARYKPDSHRCVQDPRRICPLAGYESV